MGRSVLTALGCRVIEADNAEMARAVLNEHPEIDILFTDIVMPGGVNGIELADRARALRPDLKVVFCSGFTDTSGTGDEKILENEAFIRKPYRKAELSNRLREVLAK
jgi:YesN/AraC family two-component response regulator